MCEHRSRGNVVCIATRLLSGQSGVQIPIAQEILEVFQKIWYIQQNFLSVLLAVI
jgi:hypothetical protein